MRVFVYKRTHEGDPDEEGRFGSHDCMGRLRDLSFDAVIGIGGIGSEAQNAGIAGKLNWIGIEPMRKAGEKRGSVVEFVRFCTFGTEGPELRRIAPAVAKRFYRKHAPRFVFDKFNSQERREIDKMLALVISTASSFPNKLQRNPSDHRTAPPCSPEQPCTRRGTDRNH